MALTNEDLQAIANLLEPIKEDIQELKRRTTSIELTLENETNPNIKAIADENELRKVKERLEQIA